MTPPRKRLAAWAGIVARNVAYQLPDGVEVESAQGLDVIRRRVFFEEVTMVTLHRERTALFLILSGAYALFFVSLALIFFVSESLTGGLVCLGIAAPGAIVFTLRAILGVDVVTVIGPRSRASIRFAFRKQRARETYGALCSAVQGAHRKLEEEYGYHSAVAAPPPLPEGVPVPPPLPPDES